MAPRRQNGARSCRLRIRFSPMSKSRIRPVRWRSAGMKPTPASMIARGESPVMSRVPSSTRPAVGGRSPQMHSASSLCPFPSTPATPRISPRRRTNDTPRSAGRPRSFKADSPSTRRTGSPCPSRSCATRNVTSRPTMARASAAGRRVRPGDRLHHVAAAEDGDRVADRHDLVELVGDEDHRVAVGAQPTDDREQGLRLDRRQDRRGLVQDQEVGLAIERLEDLDALLLADGQLPHDGPRVHVEAIGGRQAREPRAPRAAGSARAG